MAPCCLDSNGVFGYGQFYNLGCPNQVVPAERQGQRVAVDDERQVAILRVKWLGINGDRATRAILVDADSQALYVAKAGGDLDY